MPKRGFSPADWWALLGWPGFVTLVSLAAAWSAIGLAVTGHLKWSVLVALVAFLLDTLDGFLARRLGVESEFGRFLDSTVDLVNYSLYAAVLVAFYLVQGTWGWALGLLILVTGAMRLVRFTIDGFDGGAIKYYRGVITPHVSAAAMALLIVDQKVGDMRWASAAILAALAVAQLSGIRMRKTGRQAWWTGLVIPLSVGAVLWLP